jgi:DDE_Tnp_1-associated
MADMVNASIVEHFQTLEDPRIERTKKHPLLDILVIAVCTLLTGGEGFQDMELFGKSKQAWLQTFLALPHGIPSHDTFGRVFARLNPKRFQECFLAWTQAVAQLTHGALVSLDGKTVKSSFDRATALSPLHMLSAWCSDNGGFRAPESSSANHLVRLKQDGGGNGEAEGLGRLQVDDQLKLHRLLDGQVGGLGPLEELVHIGGGAAEEVRQARSIGHQTAGHHPFPVDKHARQVLLRDELRDAWSVHIDERILQERGGLEDARLFP